MAKPTKEAQQNDLIPYHTRLYVEQRHKLKMLMVKLQLSSEAEVIRRLIDEA